MSKFNRKASAPAQQQMPSSESAQPSRSEIEALAYSLWQARQDGRDAADEDWYEAERQLKAEGQPRRAMNTETEDEIAGQLSYLSGRQS